MGIVFVSITAEDEMLERVFNEPPLIWRLYDPDNVEFYLDEIGAGKKPGFISKLFGAKEVAAPDPLPCFKYKANNRRELDLDKAWDGINYCLSKLTIDNYLNIFEDGETIGKVDVGYGPASAFSSSEVSTLSRQISAINKEQLLAAYNPSTMHDVYPDGMWASDDEELKEYLIDNFLELKDFLKFASDQQLGLIVIYS